MTEYEKQAQDFLDRFNIGFRATLSDSKPAPWRDEGALHGSGGHHYRVTLSRPPQGRNKPQFSTRVTFDFWGSQADWAAGKTEIGAYDVLACISSDVNTPETFKEYCSDFGESEDSIKALQTFRRCDRFAKRLRAFFTAEELEALNEIQ